TPVVAAEDLSGDLAQVGDAAQLRVQRLTALHGGIHEAEDAVLQDETFMSSGSLAPAHNGAELIDAARLGESRIGAVNPSEDPAVQQEAVAGLAAIGRRHD